MMKTKMQVLAEILGVEFEEEFTLEYNETSYRCILTETGGLFYRDNTDCWTIVSSDLYRAILFDDVKVFKLYRPSEGDIYYTPYLHSTNKYSKYIWSETDFGLWALNHGLVCKTREEAEELADKLADFAKKIRS